MFSFSCHAKFPFVIYLLNRFLGVTLSTWAAFLSLKGSRSIEHIHTKHSQMNRDMENKSVGNVGSRMNHTTHGHYAERTYERLSVSTGGSCLGPAPGLILLNIFFGDL